MFWRNAFSRVGGINKTFWHSRKKYGPRQGWIQAFYPWAVMCEDWVLKPSPSPSFPFPPPSLFFPPTPLLPSSHSFPSFPLYLLPLLQARLGKNGTLRVPRLLPIVFVSVKVSYNVLCQNDFTNTSLHGMDYLNFWDKTFNLNILEKYHWS